jgi:transcriptional regulator with XRE-family HTH domain
VRKTKSQVASINSPENDILLAVLKEARLAKGVGTEKLAALASKDRNFVQRIEYGHRRIDVVEFCSLARALDINPIELFTRFIQRLSEAGLS